MYDLVKHASDLPSECQKLVGSVSSLISTNDQMFEGNFSHYFLCGASALNSILCSLSLANLKPTRILDFGCGAGRVTRWIRAAFPDSKIYGYDLREIDLDFVRHNFDVITEYACINIDELQSKYSYHLIFVGSVFTHLDSKNSIKLFHKLVEWLNPKGILIFSTHGRFVSKNGSIVNKYYGLEELKWKSLKKEYEKSGYGYQDYPSQKGYGISLSSLIWWLNIINANELIKINNFGEALWDSHHDIIAIQKI
jgi:SAM-dependent methyltransferase